MSRSPGWQKFLSGNQLDDAFLKAKDTAAFLGEFEGQLRKVMTRAASSWSGSDVPRRRRKCWSPVEAGNLACRDIEKRRHRVALLTE